MGGSKFRLDHFWIGIESQLMKMINNSLKHHFTKQNTWKKYSERWWGDTDSDKYLFWSFVKKKNKKNN